MAEESRSEEARSDETKGTVKRWEPFAELERWGPVGGFGLAPRLDRWLRELDEQWPRQAPGGSWLPALDVYETDDGYAISVELAGARKEDVTVEAEGGVVTIRGEKKNEREEKKEKRRIVERRYGTFSRSFTLPRDADGERIQASFENGVLTLLIAKNEAAKPRTVSIK